MRGWTETWSRVGNSRLFESVWYKGPYQQRALLEIHIIGNHVQVLRTNSRKIEGEVP